MRTIARLGRVRASSTFTGLALATILVAPSVRADSCFDANRLAVHGLTKWAQDACRTDFNITLDYGKLLTRFSRGNPDLVAECINSCRRGEAPDACVTRRIAGIVADFDRDNRRYLSSFCNNPDYR